MTLPVADRSSNKNEQILHAAEVLGRSPQRIAVFTEIYRGRKQIKSVSEIVDATGLARQRVCGELLFKPRQAIGTGLGSDFASGKNLDLQPWVVSS